MDLSEAGRLLASGRRRALSITRLCETCKQPFSGTPRHRFCSSRCRSRAFRRRLTDSREVEKRTLILPFLMVQSRDGSISASSELQAWRETHTGERHAPLLKLAEEVLWGSLRSAGFTFPRDHPDVERFGPRFTTPPEEIATVASLVPPDWQVDWSLSHAQTGPVYGSANRTITLMGGPIADTLVRAIFDYAATRSDHLQRDRGALALPFVFRPDQRMARRTVTRHIQGQKVPRPAWEVHAADGTAYRPEVDKNDQLRTDLLLVTRLRNFLDHEAFASNAHILSFAGTHGVGGRAARQLVSSPELLQRIADQIPEGKEFQALFRIEGIQPGNEFSEARGELRWADNGPSPLQAVHLYPEQYRALRKRVFAQLTAEYWLA